MLLWNNLFGIVCRATKENFLSDWKIIVEVRRGLIVNALIISREANSKIVMRYICNANVRENP